MSRYVDIEPIIASHTNAEYKVSDISFAEVLHAPTIKTKQIKYYDEDEQVWKIGEVIVDGEREGE